MSILRVLRLLMWSRTLWTSVLCLPIIQVVCHHSSNWAVLVSVSRGWRNYRDVTDTLSIYTVVKRLGIPDSHIILMTADDIACNARNTFPGSIYTEEKHLLDLYRSDVETDYRGHEVTVENFIRVLTGRHESIVPASKRLKSDSGSNILIYLTGHGGDEFLNFQSQENLHSKDISGALMQMYEKRRYHEILFMVDTCQAETLFIRIEAPNIICIGSSKKGESSFGYYADREIGVSLVDRFTLATSLFFADLDIESNATVQELLDGYAHHQLRSTMKYRTVGFQRPLDRVLVTDFFGHVARVHVIKQRIDLGRISHSFHFSMHPPNGGHSNVPVA